MKCILLFIFLLLFLSAGPMSSQTTFENKIQFNSKALIQANTIIQTSDGGYLAGGGTQSQMYHAEIPALIKFDSLGNIQWVRSVSNTFNVFSISELVQFSANVFYATGHIWGGGVEGAFIMKFDDQGNILWMRIHGCQQLRRMPFKVCKDGSCILGGVENAKPFVLRIDASGTLLWNVYLSYSPTPEIDISSMAQITDSSFVITGQLVGYQLTTKNLLLVFQIDLGGYVGWSRLVSSSLDIQGSSICKTGDNGFAVCGRSIDRNVYISKFDSSGAFRWGKEIDASTQVSLHGVITEAQNGDLVAVWSGNSGITGDIIVRTKNDGEVLIVKTFNETSIMPLNAIMQARDGGFVFTGNSSDSIKNPAWIIYKTDSLLNGCNIRTDFYSVNPLGLATDIVLDKQIGGAVAPFDFQFSTNLLFTETDLCNAASVTSPASQTTTLSLSPNPIHQGESLMLHCGAIPSGTYDLRIFDLLGNCQRIEKIMLSGSQQDMPINVSGLASGIYTIEIQNAQGKNICAKFVKEN